MVVIEPSSGLDTCGSVGDEPIVASRRICPVIESRSGRSRDQSEGGDLVCRPCAPGVHKLACATRLHKLGRQCPTLLNNQCRPLTGALVAVRHGQRPNTNRAWQAFTHTLILGEHTANINTLGRLVAIMGTVESESEWTVPRCARATVTISNFIAAALEEAEVFSVITGVKCCHDRSRARFAP